MCGDFAPPQDDAGGGGCVAYPNFAVHRALWIQRLWLDSKVDQKIQSLVKYCGTAELAVQEAERRLPAKGYAAAAD